MEIILIIAIGIIAIFVVAAIAKLDETVRHENAIKEAYFKRILRMCTDQIIQDVVDISVDRHIANTNEFWAIKRRLTASKKREEKIEKLAEKILKRI